MHGLPRPIPPGPGQESVWAYPRPARVEPCGRHLQVILAGEIVADTRRALRVLETSQAPAYYFPPGDVRQDLVVPSALSTWCEWKGRARYWTIAAGRRRAVDAAWSYREPAPGYEALRDHLAFYPQRVDVCLVDGERVQLPEGDFYGGWITSDVVGPFKGGPGTRGW